MLYIYSEKNDDIMEMTDAYVIDPIEYENLKTIHKEDLRNAFGKIVVNPETKRPEYRDNMVHILVDKKTNNFTRVFVKGMDTEDSYYALVKNKDFVNHSAIDSYSKIAKYYDGQFHLFDNERDKVYNPADNTWSLDLEKFKASIIKKIQNSENELRHHGFYNDLYGADNIYLQPFRTIEGDNDQTVLFGVRYVLPKQVRKLKLFKEDPVTGARLTAPKTFYWLIRTDVSDLVLDSTLMLIIAYSETIKSGIAQMVEKVKNTNNLEVLQDIDKKYVKMILFGMKQAIESVPQNKALLDHAKEEIKKANLTHILDDGIVGGGA